MRLRSARRPRFPGQIPPFRVAPAVLAFLAWAALFSGPAGAQAPAAARTALAGQVSSPDFPRLLEAAVDGASGAAEALALLEEFAGAVKAGPIRRSLYLRWAALLELSGRWEDAAARYEEAAFASPGQRDTSSLISAARDWLAAGETDKALSILKVLGVASPDPAERARVLILEGWARLIEGSPEEARTLAGQVAKTLEDREIRLAALTLLWAASEGGAREDAAALIRKEFPGTPEAVMAETGNVPAAAHWLLTPASGAPAAAGSPAPGSSAESSRISAYQVGAFSEESNSAALVKELAAKGFVSSPERREQGGRVIWAVLVSPGPDPQATLLRLKDAGYEAYPIF